MASVDRFELSETLAPDPSSVGRARGLVAQAIAAAGHDELVDVATLLVSEVVTNSVLHAGTEIQLRYRSTDIGARIEVFDRSPLMPGVRHYDPQAMTGRGLGLVSSLSSSWGVRREEGGKTLWFELGSDDDRHQPRPAEAAPEPGGEAESTFTVELRGASPSLIRATIEQGDSLLRELVLLALGGELDGVLPEGWHTPQIDVSPILAAAEAASPGGLGTADLQLTLPSGADAGGIERVRLIDHADALAREDRLLSAPALPEIAACRHWLYTQIAEQAAGYPPAQWELPAPLEPTRAAAVLPPEELERLEAATLATLVADDANRIIFVNRAAGALLGWAREALVGQRLTVVIPPELREAHLAAFTRLQLTGQPRILGRTLQVPALRHDGTRISVDLTIHEMATGGRTAFRGVLAPAEGSHSSRAL